MNEEDNKRLGELLIELANGNCLALEEIALLIERILFAIGNTYFQNYADIEDAIHDLYFELHKKAKLFHINKNASAWIITMYYNLIKNKLRRRKTEDDFLQENPTVFGRLTVDEQYIENYLYLKEIFDKLNAQERYLIVYYHWCKCSADEVAKILHIGRSTVYKKLAKLEEKIKSFKN